MSKGEDVEAYTRILKFQKKRYGVTPKDVIIFLIGLAYIIVGTFWITNKMNSTYATISLIISSVYFLAIIIAFVDYFAGLGLFKENQIMSSAIIILLSVLVSLFNAIQAQFIFNTADPDLTAMFNLVLLMGYAIFITFFIMTSSPSREGREEMIKKLEEIKTEIEKVPLSKLGMTSALSRGINWLQFQQKESGIWGEDNPLYETSQVLRTLSRLDDGLEHSWVRIVNGNEEVKTVEQTYYLVMEALETAAIEPVYVMIIPLLSIAEINSDHVEIDNEIYLDFKDELNSLSEWEFVSTIEKYDETIGDDSEIPIIFPMSKILYLKGEYDLAQKCADIFSQTFDILIRRSQTRFNKKEEIDLSNLLLGKMYNSLVLMLRGKKKSSEMSVFDEFDLNQEEEQQKPDEGTKTDKDVDTTPDMPEFDLPDFDDEVMKEDEGFDIDLPETEMSTDEEETTSKSKIKIETSMANIRNYIRSKQSIDGSWNNRIDTTAICLQAVVDQESTESEFVKLGVHYLLALQEKNGSWQDDIVLTARVIKALLQVKYSTALGGI